MYHGESALDYPNLSNELHIASRGGGGLSYSKTETKQNSFSSPEHLALKMSSRDQ